MGLEESPAHPLYRGREKSRLYGFYPAKVVNNVDPEGRLRVQIRVEMLHGPNPVEAPPGFPANQIIPDVALPFAEVMVPGGGDPINQSGLFILPGIGTPVMVVFVQGDPDSPMVVGTPLALNTKPPDIQQGRDAGVVSRNVQTGAGSRKVILNAGGVTVEASAPNEMLVLRGAGFYITVPASPGVVVPPDRTTPATGGSGGAAGVITTQSACPYKADSATIRAQILAANLGTAVGTPVYPEFTHTDGSDSVRASK